MTELHANQPLSGQTSAPLAGAPEFQVSAHRDHDALTVRYSIHNTTDASILVNAFYKDKTFTRLDPHRVVHRIEDDVLLCFQSAMHPAMPMYVPPLPASKRVRRGQRFSTSISIPWTVEFDNPFLIAEPNTTYAPRVCHGLRLIVGWIPEPELSDEIHTETVDGEEFCIVPLPPILDLQRLLISPVFEAEIVVTNPLPEPPGWEWNTASQKA